MTRRLPSRSGSSDPGRGPWRRLFRTASRALRRPRGPGGWRDGRAFTFVLKPSAFCVIL